MPHTDPHQRPLFGAGSQGSVITTAEEYLDRLFRLLIERAPTEDFDLSTPNVGLRSVGTAEQEALSTLRFVLRTDRPTVGHVAEAIQSMKTPDGSINLPKIGDLERKLRFGDARGVPESVQLRPPQIPVPPATVGSPDVPSALDFARAMGMAPGGGAGGTPPLPVAPGPQDRPVALAQAPVAGPGTQPPLGPMNQPEDLPDIGSPQANKGFFDALMTPEGQNKFMMANAVFSMAQALTRRGVPLGQAIADAGAAFTSSVQSGLSSRVQSEIQRKLLGLREREVGAKEAEVVRKAAADRLAAKTADIEAFPATQRWAAIIVKNGLGLDLNSAQGAAAIKNLVDDKEVQQHVTKMEKTFGMDLTKQILASIFLEGELQSLLAENLSGKTQLERARSLIGKLKEALPDVELPAGVEQQLDAGAQSVGAPPAAVVARFEEERAAGRIPADAKLTNTRQKARDGQDVWVVVDANGNPLGGIPGE